MRVAVIIGSMSDLPKIEPAIMILKGYGVATDVRVLSAHRTSKALEEFMEEVNSNGTEVVIAAAGMAAALPGVVAAQTILPVIGVPISGSNLEGLDALLSIVQMPSGIPVATVAINGGQNAGILAAKMLAMSDPELLEKLKAYKEDMKEKVVAKAEKLEKVGYKAYNA